MSENIDVLVGKQTVICEQMRIFVENWNKQKDKMDGYIATRLEGWNELWSSFVENHQTMRLRATTDDYEKPYFKENNYMKVESFFYNNKGVQNERLRTTRKAANERQTPPAVRKNTECKLPVLETPKFNGNFLDWPSFSDLFSSTIANNGELSNA